MPLPKSPYSGVERVETARRMFFGARGPRARPEARALLPGPRDLPVAFVGDILPALFRRVAFASDALPIFEGADFVVGNLEGIVARSMGATSSS
ncbi:MAG: hypothetical protein HYV07_25625 [Deltaproteobacteria bacterium]|nr:hypothetical protein [Deltaproteobacteria bacterium]